MTLRNITAVQPPSNDLSWYFRNEVLFGHLIFKREVDVEGCRIGVNLWLALALGIFFLSLVTLPPLGLCWCSH